MAIVTQQVTLPVAAAVLLTLVIAYVTIGAIVNYRKLQHIKGPPLAGFSLLWMFWQSINANVAIAQAAALKKYGSPARIGPNLLVVDDPDVIRHMSAPQSTWRRGWWFESMRFDPRSDTVFSTRDETIHRETKATVSGAYSGRDVENLESDIDARVIDFLSLIRLRYNKVPVDVSSIVRFFTLDVLSTVAFGRPFGFMKANEDLWDYNAANNEYFGILELVAHHRSILWLLNTRVMQWLFTPKPTDKKGMGPALAFAHEAVAERFGPDPKVKRDMLGSFVQRGMSQLQCETEAFLQIVAGSDSTTTVMRCTLYLLAGNPAAYNRLRAEVDSAAKAGQISSPVVTYAEAQKLPYMNAVLWEGLRMYPPLFGLKSKIAPAGGDTIKGVYYPAGTEVANCDSAVCRRRKIFGDDADIFRPERWLEADVEQRKAYTRTVETVFGSGRFLCLGKHIAMIELHKAYVELIRNFDWSLANPMRGITQISHGIHNQSGMYMIARPRNEQDVSTE